MAAGAQDRDFGMWYAVNAEKAFSKRFEISGNATVRTYDNGSTINQGFMELGVSYNLNRYFGIGATYRLANYLDDNYYYHIRHRWFGDVKGSLPIGDFSFSLRLRFQMTSKTYLEDTNDDRLRYYGRAKLRALYKTPHFPVNPYVSFETFSPMFRSSEDLVTKSRTTLGAEYKISKRHYVDVEYIYQRDLKPHLSIIDILSLSYTFKF